MQRRVLTAVAGWCAAAVVAFALVLVALGVSGTGLFGTTDRPLSEADAAAMLAGLPSTTEQHPTAPSDTDQASGTSVVTSSGTARIDCVAGTPRIEYISPAPGFSYSTKAVTLPEPMLYILISGGPGTVQVAANCVHGRAHATTSTQ
jgi:hypothetical protein